MIDLYGVTNFLTFNQGFSKYNEKEMTNIYDLLGCWCEDDEVLYREASPVSYLEAKMNLLPILILHGSKAVSYTHLDVYKRQNYPSSKDGTYI